VTLRSRRSSGGPEPMPLDITAPLLYLTYMLINHMVEHDA
jgi:hypothetical protein